MRSILFQLQKIGRVGHQYQLTAGLNNRIRPNSRMFRHASSCPPPLDPRLVRLVFVSVLHWAISVPASVYPLADVGASEWARIKASGKTASATLVHQNQLFIIIKVIILLDYVYIVHLMYSCLHICISIDFGNKYLSIYLSNFSKSRSPVTPVQRRRIDLASTLA